MPRARQLLSSTDAAAPAPFSLTDRPERRKDAEEGDPAPVIGVGRERAGIARAELVSSDIAMVADTSRVVDGVASRLMNSGCG